MRKIDMNYIIEHGHIILQIFELLYIAVDQGSGMQPEVNEKLQIIGPNLQNAKV